MQTVLKCDVCGRTVTLPSTTLSPWTRISFGIPSTTPRAQGVEYHDVCSLTCAQMALNQWWDAWYASPSGQEEDDSGVSEAGTSGTTTTEPSSDPAQTD